MSFLFILKLSKHFHNTLNYASTANIEEVMKFCNLGDKTFETDFNFQVSLQADALLYKNCKKVGSVSNILFRSFARRFKAMAKAKYSFLQTLDTSCLQEDLYPSL